MCKACSRSGPSAAHVTCPMSTARVQGCSGRQVSARYMVQCTVVHGDSLFAIVCPDSGTCATQRPQAMRVYALHLKTLIWSLCSPRQEDGSKMEYPIPRTQAACINKGAKVSHSFTCCCSCCSPWLLWHMTDNWVKTSCFVYCWRIVVAFLGCKRSANP